jgi:hypothetical protein
VRFWLQGSSTITINIKEFIYYRTVGLGWPCHRKVQLSRVPGHSGITDNKMGEKWKERDQPKFVCSLESINRLMTKKLSDCKIRPSQPKNESSAAEDVVNEEYLVLQIKQVISLL